MFTKGSCCVTVWLVLMLASSATAESGRPCATEAQAAGDAGEDAALTYPTEPAAVQHLEAGNRAFRVQEYDKAIEEYTAAGLATSAPLVLYNLGQSLRAAKQYDKAIRQYELFISRGNPGSAMRALVECHIATMRSELDAAASTAPPSGPAPDHQQAAGPGARPVDREGPVTAERSTWTGRRKIAIAVGAVGVLAGGAGIVLGFRAKGFEDDAAEICPMAACARSDEANDLVDKAETNATYANIAFGVGAAAVVAGVVLWFTGSPDDERETKVSRINPYVTSDSAGVNVRLSF